MPLSIWVSSFGSSSAWRSPNAIGWERESRGAAAGDRAFALVSLGAAAFTAVGIENFPGTAEKVMPGERVFQPEPCGEPGVMPSNDDGCVIARSSEAKALGIGDLLVLNPFRADRHAGRSCRGVPVDPGCAEIRKPMHTDSMDRFRHEHVFLGEGHARNERRTWLVIALCAAMMAAEIGGGLVFGSMALIADGLHMSTHTAALLIAALAYSFARWHARDERFAFGTGKFGDLAGFSSAIVLAMIALLIGWESITRLLHPVAIAFDEAIPIAAVGLGVNLLSAWLLRHEPHHEPHHHHGEAHDHGHHHSDHDHAHHDHHTDLNLRAAYVHVLADAAVSLLAVLGLLAAREFGLVWIDPFLGIVGAGVIANWSFGLIKAAGAVLLDMRAPDLAEAVRERLEVGDDRLADLHLWRVGPAHMAAVVSIVADHPQPPAVYKARLAGLAGLSHVTVEVQPCPGHVEAMH